MKPLGDSRPGWKVLRVLGGLIGLEGFLFNMPEEVLGEALNDQYCAKLNNRSSRNALGNDGLVLQSGLERLSDVNIYAGDQIVRRSSALQLTRDAKRANQVGLGQKIFTDLGLSEGDIVCITQGDQSLKIPATLEANLASGVVRISVGNSVGAKLGPMFGPITVSKA